MLSYATVHIYLKRDRGSPANYECALCQEEAEEWAYDLKDPKEVYSESRNRTYSLKYEHYLPMCVPCHRRFDRSDTCRKGHPYTDENTYHYEGYRFCRACRKKVSNAYYHKVVKHRKKEDH